MPAPPRARTGTTAESAGRSIVAGIAPYRRLLSPRASLADLWSSVDALAADPSRLGQRGTTSLARRDARRFTAFIAQAKQYYSAVGDVEPVAKPLLAYYFALNLSKAYLTAVSPESTAGRLVHGVSPDVEEKQKYRIEQEGIRIRDSGVFRLLAQATGQGFCWPAGQRIQLIRLFRYLPEAVDLYADAYGKAPRLIPASSIEVLFGAEDGEQAAWLRVEVEKPTIRERKLGAARLLTEARAFGDRFRLVSDKDLETFSYESQRTAKYTKKRSEVLPSIRKLFDGCLFAVRRHRGGDVFITQSVRQQLLSHEAVTFAVFHHLSDMVRYRPEVVEQLRGSRHFWIFSSWIDRACENLLLTLASRITREEHVIA